MEEVEGSSPSRSTNLLNNLELLDYARPGLGPRERPSGHLRRRHFVRLASPVGALLPRIPFSDLTCHGQGQLTKDSSAIERLFRADVLVEERGDDLVAVFVIEPRTAVCSTIENFKAHR